MEADELGRGAGQIKSGVGPFLERRQRERQAFVFRQPFPTRGDKAVRAQSIRGRMALDGLYVPVDAPWYADFKSELLSFPAGKHDDQVDAIGLVGQIARPDAFRRRAKEAGAETGSERLLPPLRIMTMRTMTGWPRDA